MDGWTTTNKVYGGGGGLAIYLYLYVQITEPHHEKTCLCHMRTTKAQISLCIRASIVYLHLLKINCSRAGWFESTLVTNPEDRFLVTRLNILCFHVFLLLLLHTCEPSRISREPPRNVARLPHSRE